MAKGTNGAKNTSDNSENENNGNNYYGKLTNYFEVLVLISLIITMVTLGVGSTIYYVVAGIKYVVKDINPNYVTVSEKTEEKK